MSTAGALTGVIEGQARGAAAGAPEQVDGPTLTPPPFPSKQAHVHEVLKKVQPELPAPHSAPPPPLLCDRAPDTLTLCMWC